MSGEMKISIYSVFNVCIINFQLTRVSSELPELSSCHN